MKDTTAKQVTGHHYATSGLLVLFRPAHAPNEAGGDLFVPSVKTGPETLPLLTSMCLQYQLKHFPGTHPRSRTHPSSTADTRLKSC